MKDVKFFCKDCKSYSECVGPLADKFSDIDFSHSRPCIDFEFSMKKKYVLVHHYLESGFKSIVAFSDDNFQLAELRVSQPHFDSLRHDYVILHNDVLIRNIKDSNLINICKNVAEYLSIGEYAMLKKSYLKSSAWFEKAKNSASLASDILENY